MCHRTRIVALLAVLGGAVTGLAAERNLASTERFPSDAGKRVVVDADTLDIHLRGADVRDIEVATELRISGVGEDKADDWIRRHTPAIEDGDRRLVVTAQPGEGGFLGLGFLTARARIGVVAPPTTIPDLTTTGGGISVRGDFPLADPLMLRTATGDMEVVGAATALDIRTAAGDARVDVVRPLERLFARTSSGNIQLAGGARRVHVDTASGDVWLDNLSGSVEVETATGRITLRWDRLESDDEVLVRTSSGRIHIVLPEGVAAGGTVRTTAGAIRSDLPGTVNAAGDSVELAGDGPTLTVSSESGEIILSRAYGWETVEPASPGR